MNVTIPSLIRIPHGIVDVQADVAYVVGNQGRIFCLSLEAGDILASTDNASVPLAVDKGMLIGWSHTPHRPNEIHLFSAARQGHVLRVQWKQALQLPEWVDPTSPEPDSFVLEAGIREGRVIVTWEAHARYRGGAAPSVEVEKSATHDERQTLELDGKDGAIAGQPRVEPAPRLDGITPRMKPNTKIVSYRSGSSWETGPWRAGTVNACLIRTADDPGIVLWHRDDVGPEAEFRLTGSPNAVAAVTLDGGFIFIHEPEKTESAWHVFSTETGSRVASLGFDPGTEGVSIVNASVLYVMREDAKGMHRRTLQCRSFPAGKPMWSFVLEEEAMRVAPPPPR